MIDARRPLPMLTGERVRLREWRESDIAIVQEAASDPLIPLITTVPRLAGEAAARAFVRRQHDRLRSGEGYAFAIADHDDRAVGHIGLFRAGDARASVGYWIGSSQRRLGYAGDALATLTRWAITREGIDRVEL